MTINKYLQQISPEDLAYVKRYHHEIQPFRVLPSSTLEFDGQFAYTALQNQLDRRN